MSTVLERSSIKETGDTFGVCCVPFAAVFIIPMTLMVVLSLFRVFDKISSIEVAALFLLLQFVFPFVLVLVFHGIRGYSNNRSERKRIRRNTLKLLELSTDRQDQAINRMDKGDVYFKREEREIYYRNLGRESDYFKYASEYWEHRSQKEEYRKEQERLQRIREHQELIKNLMTRCREDIKLFLDKYITRDERQKYIDDLSNYLNHTYSAFDVDDDMTVEIIEAYQKERSRSIIFKALSELDYVEYDNIGDIYFHTYNPKLVHSDTINYDFVEAIEDYYPGTDTAKLESNIRAHIKKTRAELFKLSLRSDSILFVENINDMQESEFLSYLKELFAYIDYKVETLPEKDMGADLIISHRSRKTAVQVRRSMDDIGSNAIKKAAAAKSHYECDRVMVITNANFTEIAKEHALGLNVELIDGKELVEMINSR